MSEYTNGVCLMRDKKTHKIDDTHSVTTIHKVVQYSDGKIVAIYRSEFIYLKPMKIVLTSDNKYYWIDGAVAYDYDIAHRYGDLDVTALYIGMSSNCAELINPEHLKLCFQDEIKEPKKPRKRTKVLDTDKQETVSTSVS